MEVIILMGSFLVMLVLRVPIALTLIISSLLTGIYMEIEQAAILQRMVGGLNSFSLLAIPFFILAGEIMNEGGISRRLINLSNVIIGRIRGGLALVNILASTFFGGISGSAVADTSSVGAVMIPMMKKQGYKAEYATAVTVSSAAQGVLIPPSHNMIIYSTAAGGVSVGALFMGGLLPGLLLGFSLMVFAYVMAIKQNHPKGEVVQNKDIPRIVWEGLLGLLTAVIIIGGIVSGIFTATESAAIGTLYAFIITFFVYRDISIIRMGVILQRTFKTLAMVMFLIAASSSFGWLLALLKVPVMVAEALISISPNNFITILFIMIILLALGTVMDMAPLILIATPILLPVAITAGMDPVHFGVLLILCLAIGLITPPVGTVLFVGSAIGRISIEKTSKALLPFYGIMVVVLLLVAYIPGLVLLLPDLLIE
ncbi:putative TRAP-type C4-dicarboxylate transport system, large permease component [Planococcus sp. PAMC 21323]|uniref:TRAP transporter large permease n=1 Tax=Planococcus sp. PAMC 21323 TaxID=1526927 RepID=UPI00056E78EB|nr:TRAP transporter large permease [Planococcus sp. PAMC 21323]AIY05684.1 putative TRAP-type C4-dicarboxylate transport system, large permease component [Planococcus sp. PAMC 21323]